MTGCRDCSDYEKTVKELRGEIACLRFELNKFKSDFFNRKKKKPKTNSKKKTSKRAKSKIGGLFGHIGWFRQIPNKIDKIVEVEITECPVCGSSDLRKCKGSIQHTQQDIIMPGIITTRFNKKKYYCPVCRDTVTGRGKDELDNSRIGPIAKALAIYMKFDVKVSDGDIRKVFDKIFGLKLCHSAITDFRRQATAKAERIYSRLIAELRNSPFNNGDETGWKINGKTGWLWKFVTKSVSVTHIDPSRGQKVVQSILGDKYDGVLITDFLSAYNKIDAKKQRCLLHLLRDLSKVIEFWDREDSGVIRYSKRLVKILKDGIELYDGHRNKEWDEEYIRKRERIVESLADLRFPDPNKKILNRIAKRLERHKDEIFTFLYVKDIEYHNNRAEREIRPGVILRKITYGNRSENGARYHSVLMSVIQTAKLNGMDVLDTLKTILLGNGNPFAGIIDSS
jgi:hypothetical protein